MLLLIPFKKSKYKYSDVKNVLNLVHVHEMHWNPQDFEDQDHLFRQIFVSERIFKHFSLKRQLKTDWVQVTSLASHIPLQPESLQNAGCERASKVNYLQQLSTWLS